MFSTKRILAIILTISVTLVGLSSCSKTSTPVSNSPNNLDLLQQNKFLTGRFYGLMTFKFSGTTFTFPTELQIASVPVTWMGELFNGKLEEVGPGEDVTDEVHGSVSSDGNWLVTLYYSRQILRTSNNTGTFFRVTFRNVPIMKQVNGVVTEVGTFEKDGADLQKYVEKIEYIDGTLNGNQIVPTSSYLSTDWKNTGNGLKPSLKLTFEKEPSQEMGPLPEAPKM